LNDLDFVEEKLAKIRKDALASFHLRAEIKSGSIVLWHEVSYSRSYIDDAVERCGAYPTTMDLKMLRELREQLRGMST